MQKKAYYSPGEVADYFDVNVETIRRMCRDGLIPGARQVGRQWRIPSEYLEKTQSIQETDEEKKNRQK
jgi:excisionase family DNA binding protein